MVHALSNWQCNCNLLHRYPPRTHVSNRHELRLAYPPPTNPHWFYRLDLRIWSSWKRAVSIYYRRDNFKEGYSKFTAPVSFFLSFRSRLHLFRETGNFQFFFHCLTSLFKAGFDDGNYDSIMGIDSTRATTGRLILVS